MAPGSDGEESSFPNWGRRSSRCKSVLDIDIRSADELPFEPPIAKYLEESLNGLRGSPNDVKTRRDDPKLKRYVDHLFAIVHNSREASNRTCHDLFFIALGLLFGRMLPDVVEKLRGSLARSWHVACLSASKEIPSNLEARDWTKMALPQVMVQAIYRLLIDAFPLERSDFVKKAAEVLDKLMQLVHFESAGFQVQQETLRKERGRLFVKHVLNNPHISLDELQRDKKRQEFLESQNKTVQDQPLTFGTIDRAPLEKEQMKHLLEIRQENQLRVAQASIGASIKVTARSCANPPDSPTLTNAPSPDWSEAQMTKRGAVLSRWATPPQGTFVCPRELCVDKYDGLAERGARMHERQLRELAQSLGEVGDDDDTEASTSQPSRPSSPSRPSIPSDAAKQAWVPGSDMKRCSTAPGRARRSVKISSKDKEKDKEKADKQKKARKDMVLAQISAPMPTELCQRKLCTSWSSPFVTLLCGEDGDRNVLRKSPCEAFHLQMKTPTIPGLGARPASAPLKAQSRKSFETSQRSTQGSLRGSPTGKDETGTSLSSSGTRSPSALLSMDTRRGSTSPAGRKGTKMSQDTAPMEVGRTWTQDSTMGHSRSFTKSSLSPDGASATRKPAMTRVSSAGRGDQGFETITMEMRPISMKTTMQRLEQMSQQFRQKSFGEYMKEYDIFTGDKKTRLNGSKLSQDEESYVREMKQMVGGQRLAVNPFSKSQIKRMAQVVAASGPRRPPEAEERQSAEVFADSGIREDLASGVPPM